MRRLLFPVLTLAVLLVCTGLAEAAFPGENGRIAFTRYHNGTDIYTVDPSGMAEFRVTNDAVSGGPAFSPDGDRLAFWSAHRLYTSDMFGNDRNLVIESPGGAADPDWSPDGEKLVVSIPNCAPEFDCATDIYVVNTDGSGLTNLTNSIFDEYNPAWSPDGTRIAFDSARLSESDVYVVNPDGTGLVNATTEDSVAAIEPDWSPEASRIAYNSGDSIRTVNPDGTGLTYAGQGYDPAWSPDGTMIARTRDRSIHRAPVSGAPSTEVTGEFFGTIWDREPDWQPLHSPPPSPAASGSGYPRPKGARPTRLALVMAYAPCTEAWDNRQHGPPLAYPSCNPPYQYVTALIVGSPDVNGHAAQAIGYVQVDPIAGDSATPADEADVRLEVNQTDVRVRAPGQPDFNGSLVAEVPLRITDRWNGGGADGSATVIEFALRLAVPCSGTPDTTIGGTCAVDTTADALAPGLVPEGKRSIWELGQVEIFHDPNPDSLVDDRLFLTQGVFVP
jgi:Tol biopolymer transport system component